MASPHSRIVRLSLGAGFALVLVLTGCVATETSEHDGVATDFGHVHGLGIDPSSGAVFAATHSGVWKLPAIGSPTVPQSALEGPIAGRAQDTMGFTIVDGRMLASGHPDPLEHPDLVPANLGLIESYDNAATWSDVSGWGETDFHDISAVRQPSGALTVFGYHAGSIWLSLDSGQTWVVGAQLGLRDLVVDPTEAGLLYATTEAGLMASTDNGATFAAVPDAPALYLIDAGNDGDLVGIDLAGAVWVRPAGGEWRRTGTVEGVVDALAYSSDHHALVAYDSRGVVVSGDFGASWQVLVSR